MTTRQVAESLGVSLWAVYRLIGGRHVSARRVGGRWQVDGSSVDAYVAANTVTARQLTGALHLTNGE